MIITSVNNSKIKDTISLKEKKIRDTRKEFLIEGDHLVIEALKRGLLKTVFLLEKAVFDGNVETIIVSENVMKKLSQTKSVPNMIGICEKLNERNTNGNVLILDNIQDPGNLGTIIRSAVAFKVDTIYLSETSVDLYNDKVVRSTEGNLFNINVVRCNLIDKINELKESGYTVIGTDVKEGSDIKNISFLKYALVMGNEGQGVSENISKLCDINTKIDMDASCESLNVSVATSILLYELGRK